MARVALPRRSTAAQLSAGSQAVAALLGRLRADGPLIAVVAAVVLVTSLVFASVPRLYNQISDDGLRTAIDDAPPFLRNLQMSRAGRVAPGPEGNLFQNVESDGQAFQDDLSPGIQELIDHRTFVFESARYIFAEIPGQQPFPFPRYMNMRYQSEVDQHITLVDGRMPANVTDTVPIDFPNAQNQTSAMRFELAVSPETARQLGANLGDRFFVFPFDPDPLVRRTPITALRFVVIDLVGFIELNDTTDAFWFADPRMDRAVEYDDGSQVHIYATGLMAPDAYPRLLEAAAPMSINYSYRYFTDTDAFDAGALDGLASDIRRLDAEYPSSGLSRPEETSVRTGLSNIFRRYLSQRALTESILSLATIGLLAVALAVIGLVAALIAERRRDLYHIVRSRGASSAQLIAAQIAEGLLLTVPPALIGFLLATVLLDARPSQLSRDATALIVVATVVLLVVASLPFARRSLLTIERADVVVRRPSARRLVLEGLIVGVALIGVYLIRRRGLSADSSAEDVGGFDIYLAAVPVLLSLATGVLVLRLYPLPLRLFAWIASLRRDLIPSLGFRRVARQPSVISAPLLVLVLAVAVGVFSSVLLYSIDQGQLRTSWQTVGADYRVDSFQGTPLYRGIDLTTVDEIDGIAPASLLPDIPLVVTQPVFGRVSLLAVDTPAYQEVAGGTPADPRLPNALLREPAGQDFGTPSNPIPAIVSTRWVSTGGIRTGDTFTLDIAGLEVSFVVSQLRETFPGIEIGNAFVVTDLRAIQAMVPERPMRPNRLYLNAPDDTLETIDETLASQSPSAQLTSRAAEYAEVHEAPLIAGVARGFRVGVIVAAAYSALAVAVALALTARARARDLAFLRTLGLSERQVLGLVVVEQAPPVAVALGVGLVLGIAIARLVEPGLDLTAFTGPGVPIELVIDTSTLVLISASIVAVVTVAIAVVTVAAQRANLGSALRLGDD